MNRGNMAAIFMAMGIAVIVAAILWPKNRFSSMARMWRRVNFGRMINMIGLTGYGRLLNVGRVIWAGRLMRRPGEIVTTAGRALRNLIR